MGKLIDFTLYDIEKYLDKFKSLIKNNQYTISLNVNRKENINFIRDYRINTRKEKEILLSIEAQDFCYAVNNRNKGYEHEILYIFCKSEKLDNWGSLEKVDIYIKINIVETRRGNKNAIVISFHKRNKPIKYLFR